jgi:hypothetical protein
MLSVKMLLKCIKCRLITDTLHFLIILGLVADKHLCHYYQLNSKEVISLCSVLLYILEYSVVHCNVNINIQPKNITDLE